MATGPPSDMEQDAPAAAWKKPGLFFTDFKIKYKSKLLIAVKLEAISSLSYTEKLLLTVNSQK